MISNPRELRLRKLFHPENGRSVMIPADHGRYLGNTAGLEDPYNLVRTLIEEEIDATIMCFGLGKVTADLFGSRYAPARIIAIDNALFANIPGEQQGVIGYEPGVTPELALKWGFDAIKVLFIWGVDPDLQSAQLRYMSELVAECDRLNMPLMIEPVLWGNHIPDNRKNDPDMIAHACRIAMELGADMLKVPYTGDKESFSSIVEMARIPVLVLGGPGGNTTRAMLQVAHDSISAGGRGIVFGRSVWAGSNMRGFIRALKDTVYHQIEVDKLMNKYDLS